MAIQVPYTSQNQTIANRPSSGPFVPTATTTAGPAGATGPTAAASPYVFQGIGAGQRRTGTQALSYLEGVYGQPATAEQRAALSGHIGYTDQTGATELNDTDYNRLMEYAAKLTGGSYAAATPAAGEQQPYPNTGPVYPQEYVPPTATPAPTYTPPVYQQSTFQAPSWGDVANDPGYQFRQREGQGAIEASAAARGMTRTGRTLRATAEFNQGLASQEYQQAYDRAGQTFDRNTGENRFGYGTRVEGAQAAYAPQLLDWQANREDGNRAAELNYDRSWQRELYGRDDAWRQSVYNRDDAWRQRVMEEERRRFLATQGQQAAAS